MNNRSKLHDLLLSALIKVNSFSGFPEQRSGPLNEKKHIGKTRREPNKLPGFSMAGTYCLCLNNYKQLQNHILKYR